MCLMCFVCLGCRKQTKCQEAEPETVRPSTTDETEAIIDNMVVPPKRRRSTWLMSSSTVFGSVSEAFSPPAACRPAAASSPNYRNPRLSSDTPLYVESYPLCRSDTETQFQMDSCEGSTASKPSEDFSHGRGHSSATPHYDLPISYKKSVTGEDLDEVFLYSTSGDSCEEVTFSVVTVHIENMDNKQDFQHGVDGDDVYQNLSDVGITPEEKDNLINGTSLTEMNGVPPCVPEKLQFKAQGTPPLPRARLSLWNPLDVPKDIITGSSEASAQEGLKFGLKPRPCSMPHYVNFKGCVNS